MEATRMYLTPLNKESGQPLTDVEELKTRLGKHIPSQAISNVEIKSNGRAAFAMVDGKDNVSKIMQQDVQTQMNLKVDVARPMTDRTKTQASPSLDNTIVVVVAPNDVAVADVQQAMASKFGNVLQVTHIKGATVLKVVFENEKSRTSALSAGTITVGATVCQIEESRRRGNGRARGAPPATRNAVAAAAPAAANGGGRVSKPRYHVQWVAGRSAMLTGVGAKTSVKNLSAACASFGAVEPTVFVSHRKGTALINFVDAASLNKAIAASPISVDDVSVVIAARPEPPAKPATPPASTTKPAATKPATTKPAPSNAKTNGAATAAAPPAAKHTSNPRRSHLVKVLMADGVDAQTVGPVFEKAGYHVTVSADRRADGKFVFVKFESPDLASKALGEKFSLGNVQLSMSPGLPKGRPWVKRGPRGQAGAPDAATGKPAA